MAKPTFTPLKQTPKVVSQGSISKPSPQPRPSFQGPLLGSPKVTAPTKLVRRIA